MSEDKDTEVEILDDIQLEGVVGGRKKKATKKKATKKKAKRKSKKIWAFKYKKRKR